MDTYLCLDRVKPIWWPDHLMGVLHDSLWQDQRLRRLIPGPHAFLEPTTTVAAVAAHTSKIKLGIGVTDLIRRSPALLAQTALTLDHVTKGRLILGLGAGEAENIRPYGLAQERAVDRLEEGIRIVRLLWSSRGEKVGYEGRFWKLKNAVLGLKPYGASSPPIWLGAYGKRMLRITGMLADGWLPRFSAGVQDYRESRERLEVVKAAAEDAGRPIGDIKLGLWAWLVIANRREDVDDMLRSPAAKALGLLFPSELYEKVGFEHPLGPGFRGIVDYIPSELTDAQFKKALEGVPTEALELALLHGTPSDVIEELEAYRKVGLQHVVLQNFTFFCDPDKLVESFKGMEEILIHFKALLRTGGLNR